EQSVNVDDVKIEMKIEDTAAPDEAASAASAVEVPMLEPSAEDDPAKAVKDAVGAASTH
ncbi:MAG: hypothetical protein HYX44_06890, partial [Aquabacterium sp.]|nr:hypothetical protein [Aquabacterium sp.]